MISTDIQTYYRASTIQFTNYWVDFIHQSQNINDLASEKENLLLAFQKAIDFGLIKMALCIHPLYDFFAEQGYYTQLRQVLMYLDQNLADIDDPKLIAKNYEKLGMVEFSLENFVTARSHFLKGVEYATEANLTKQLVSVEFEFAKLEADSHQYAHSDKLLLSALKKVDKVSEPFNYCSILSILGKNAYFQGRYSEAVDYCGQALPIAIENKFDSTTSALYSTLGTTEYAQKKYPESHQYLSKGLLFARESGETAKINNLLTNLGSLATELGEFDRSIPYLEEALGLSQQIGSTGYMAHILMDLGLSKFKVGEKEQGAIFIDESVVTAKEFDDWSLYMHVLLKRAGYYKELELIQPAILDWEAIVGLETSDYIWVKEELAAVHWNLTTAYDALGEPEKALENAHKSLELYKTLESPEKDKVVEWLAARN